MKIIQKYSIQIFFLSYVSMVKTEPIIMYDTHSYFQLKYERDIIDVKNNLKDVNNLEQKSYKNSDFNDWFYKFSNYLFSFKIKNK